MDQRLNRLFEPHVAPLNRLAEDWSRGERQFPWVDPNDGGINAKVLVLFETPGPKSVGSGFVSLDNPDPSARNMTKVVNQSGLKRTAFLFWNVAPFYISTAQKDAKTISSSDRRIGAPYVQQFIDQMIDLRAVVFSGGPAKKVLEDRLLKTGNARCFGTYHPGAKAYNRPHLREHLHATFAEVAAFVLNAG